MRHMLVALAITATIVGTIDPSDAATVEADRQYHRARDMTLWRRADGTYSSPAPSGAWWTEERR